MSSNNQKNQPRKKQERPLKKVALLTGLAFQMAIITGLGAFVGYKLDERYNIEDSIYTIIGTFIGFAIAMYMVVKQANKLSNS